MTLATLAPTLDQPRSEAAHASAAPGKEWWIEIATDRASLEKHVPAWERLAACTVEPNVFYEPWMFLPGLDAFGEHRKLACVLVYRRPDELCGFFPFERLRRFKQLPVGALELWDHRYGFLSTPLLHRDWPRETLHAFFDGVATSRLCSLLSWPKVHGDGPFHHALLEVLNERRMLSFVDSIHTRALLRRDASAEAYLSKITSSGRKQWRRLRKRLAEEGRLESRALTADDDVQAWIDAFLRVEASGWKGQDGTALASAGDRTYFETIARNAFARGQLHMLGLFLDHRAIAMQCNFLSGSGAFAFKIAFDEAFAKFSPGIQLELDNIDDLHRRTSTTWMDSCVDPGPHMIDRLWLDRRVIQSVVIATSRWVGNAVVGALPLARACKRMWVGEGRCAGSRER